MDSIELKDKFQLFYAEKGASNLPQTSGNKGLPSEPVHFQALPPALWPDQSVVPRTPGSSRCQQGYWHNIWGIRLLYLHFNKYFVFITFFVCFQGSKKGRDRVITNLYRTESAELLFLD